MDMVWGAQSAARSWGGSFGQQQRGQERQRGRGRGLERGEPSTFKTEQDKVKLHLFCNKAKDQPGTGLSCGPEDRGHLPRVTCPDAGIKNPFPSTLPSRAPCPEPLKSHSRQPFLR